MLSNAMVYQKIASKNSDDLPKSNMILVTGPEHHSSNEAPKKQHHRDHFKYES